MSNSNTGIDWTERTWNAVTGCTKITSGCKHCYAETLAKRLQSWGNPRYTNGFDITLHEDLIEAPLHWKKPSVIFVNSMSDFFHKDIPRKFRLAMIETMRKAHWHTFQILTKRAAAMYWSTQSIDYPPNVWLGVTIEGGTKDEEGSWHFINNARCALRFVSCEPLISDLLHIDLSNIDWVICGGESQRGCRTMDLDWARKLRDACIESNTPFFLKQLGGYPDKRHNEKAVLDGKLWRQMPTKETQKAIKAKDALLFR